MLQKFISDNVIFFKTQWRKLQKQRKRNQSPMQSPSDNDWPAPDDDEDAPDPWLVHEGPS